MCNIKEGFKLCTCNEVDQKSTHWKLLRFKGQLNIVIGIPNFSPYDRFLDFGFIQDELNARNCFDFEYSPKNDDRLIINIFYEEQDMLSLCYDYHNDKYFNGWHFVDVFTNDGAEVFEYGKVKV